jgi:putative radical SAM enzyme (TIGR03279 family)
MVAPRTPTVTSTTSPAQVDSVLLGSPADLAGVLPGDRLRTIDGVVPRDVLHYHQLLDAPQVLLEIEREGEILHLQVVRESMDGEGGAAGLQPFGIQVSSPVFDKVRTCDNHCSFCFIYQLPKGLRRSLYVKDDDYRLSFLYGNFTTLTRFTEADLERCLQEGLSPLWVSIHTTNPSLRAEMLRNPRGATSLRWLSELLDAGIEVHGQVVVCPGLNDGQVLEETLTDILDQFWRLSSVAVVPLGVSRFSKEPGMRPHSKHEAQEVFRIVKSFQEDALRALGRRMAFLADEYYLLSGEPFDSPEDYEDFPHLENGVGMAAALRIEMQQGRLLRKEGDVVGNEAVAGKGLLGGFFQSVEGAPAFGYRETRRFSSGSREPGSSGSTEPDSFVSGQPGHLVSREPDGSSQEIFCLTGAYGERVLRWATTSVFGIAPEELGLNLVSVENQFFGGNIAVSGLLAGRDVMEALSRLPSDCKVVLPDVALSRGRFIDGLEVVGLQESWHGELEVVPANGVALREMLLREKTR